MQRLFLHLGVFEADDFPFAELENLILSADAHAVEYLELRIEYWEPFDRLVQPLIGVAEKCRWALVKICYDRHHNNR